MAFMDYNHHFHWLKFSKLGVLIIFRALNHFSSYSRPNLPDFFHFCFTKRIYWINLRCSTLSPYFRKPELYFTVQSLILTFSSLCLHFPQEFRFFCFGETIYSANLNCSSFIRTSHLKTPPSQIYRFPDDFCPLFSPTPEILHFFLQKTYLLHQFELFDTSAPLQTRKTSKKILFHENDL